jgi:hypothetical protein
MVGADQGAHNSMASSICHLQIKHALNLHKRIIPIQYADFDREPSVIGIKQIPHRA